MAQRRSSVFSACRAEVAAFAAVLRTSSFALDAYAPHDARVVPGLFFDSRGKFRRSSALHHIACRRHLGAKGRLGKNLVDRSAELLRHRRWDWGRHEQAVVRRLVGRWIPQFGERRYLRQCFQAPRRSDRQRAEFSGLDLFEHGGVLVRAATSNWPPRASVTSWPPPL